jgi:hypothetical protein
MIEFQRKRPRLFKSGVDEVVWYFDNVLLNGEAMTRTLMAQILATHPTTIDTWLAAARDRRKTERVRGEGPRRSARNINPRTLRLLRLELGVERPYHEMIEE